MLVEGAMGVALVAAIAACALMCLYRVACGPTGPDRVAAINTLNTLAVGSCALLALLTGRGYLLTVALAWALLGFVGCVAMAKYFEGKRIDE